MNRGTRALSPAMAHVEALKSLSKKQDSVHQSLQSMDMQPELDINLPSDLDTPQCSRMVRDMEHALREGDHDGNSHQGIARLVVMCGDLRLLFVASRSCVCAVVHVFSVVVYHHAMTPS